MKRHRNLRGWSKPPRPRGWADCKVMWFPKPGTGVDHCTTCSEPCFTVGVCCSSLNHADGSYDEPYCRTCCPTHGTSATFEDEPRFRRVPFFAEPGRTNE